MIEKKLGILFAIISVSAAIALQGCTTVPESNIAKNGNTNQAVVVSNTTNINSAATPANTPAMNINAVSNVNSAPATNKKPVSKVTEPTPKIGSGGDDLLLFTQVRGKLLAEKELEYVIIDVKEGNVVLSGNVSSEDNKKKAEQLAKSVAGVKSLKNNLIVAK